jgi:hypothetical protein
MSASRYLFPLKKTFVSTAMTVVALTACLILFNAPAFSDASCSTDQEKGCQSYCGGGLDYCCSHPQGVLSCVCQSCE